MFHSPFYAAPQFLKKLEMCSFFLDWRGLLLNWCYTTVALHLLMCLWNCFQGTHTLSNIAWPILWRSRVIKPFDKTQPFLFIFSTDDARQFLYESLKSFI